MQLPNAEWDAINLYMNLFAIFNILAVTTAAGKNFKEVDEETELRAQKYVMEFLKMK